MTPHSNRFRWRDAALLYLLAVCHISLAHAQAVTSVARVQHIYGPGHCEQCPGDHHEKHQLLKEGQELRADDELRCDGQTSATIIYKDTHMTFVVKPGSNWGYVSNPGVPPSAEGVGGSTGAGRPAGRVSSNGARANAQVYATDENHAASQAEASGYLPVMLYRSEPERLASLWDFSRTNQPDDASLSPVHVAVDVLSRTLKLDNPQFEFITDPDMELFEINPDIALSVRSIIALKKAGLNTYGLAAIADKGTVVLTGSVTDKAQKALAGNTLLKVGDIYDVENHLTVERYEPNMRNAPSAASGSRKSMPK
ncbi:BON domain-containing protein [Paraburkholderia sediminicola]|uniref:BON domain-containing protein n=1 Tax=Paraburkholderia sediminicola TaxID=458836 RepID=UPI0038B87E30